MKCLRFVLLCILLLAGHPAGGETKPNVVVILIDDMGYGDIAAHGNPAIDTPHLDRLHADSARLTDFHVDPTCSPTRAALLTGRYPHRVGVWHTIAGGNHLRVDEMTMADVFRANGYRTGMFGKWHLGSNFPYRPIDRGFDEWLGQGDGGTGSSDDHFLNDRVNDHFLHNGEWKRIDGWAEDVFFKAANDFIRHSKRDGKPFFAYIATYSPHHPVTLPDTAAAAKHLGGMAPETAFFFAAIERIDGLIGNLRATLAAEDLARDTLLLFLTDNGGTYGVRVFDAGMRGRKGGVHDGGHRVPCFIHWPGGGLDRGRDVPSLQAHIDLLPTLVELCGLTLPRQVRFDGRSLANALRTASSSGEPVRTLFVERQRTFKPEKNRGFAAMTSRWRLVDDRELYDIKADPGQKHNVISKHPEVGSSLREDYEAYWKMVSPGDREPPVFVVGDSRDAETLLSSSDWYLPNPPWNHVSVANGPPVCGVWHVRAAADGEYLFEVRRWPREADAPLDGIPVIRKTVDAWDVEGPKKDLLYGSEKTRFRKLPVTSVRLTIGESSMTLPAISGAKAVTFTMPLKSAVKHAVKAELLDSAGALLGGGYYVYCSKERK